MWDSEVNPWNAADMGPKQDVVGEIEKAVRKRNLKFLVSMHHHWLWGWYPTWDATADTSDPKYSSLYGPKYVATARGKTLDSHFDGFGSKDIRFTTRDRVLYGIALGWPEDGKLIIKSFSIAKYATQINDVILLGHNGRLKWKRTLEGLEIVLPKRRPCEHAYVFKAPRI